jgi:hypothetical protein
MRSLVVFSLASLATACAGGGGSTQAPAPAAAPASASPAAQQVMQQAAAASAEAAKPRDIDPSGNYNVGLTYGGQPTNVYLQLWSKEDGSGYAGQITAEGVPTPIPLMNIKIAGKKVTGNLNSPDGSAITMEFTIDGDTLNGAWRSGSGDGSAMSGKRAP